MKRQAGFSLVELLVASTIMLLVFALVYTAFIQTRKIILRHEMDTDITQYARVGLNELARTIRMIGYQRDREHGQPAIIEAAPFQLIMNADVREDIPALDKGDMVKLSNSEDYIVPQQYTTGAETLRWTLDSKGDGIIDALDINDDREERETSRNPNDMALIREVNGGNDAQVTLQMRGPYDVYDGPTYLMPLFQYWVLGVDPETKQLTYFLWGDCDRNGFLEGEERYFRPITSQWILEHLHRVQITLTTESNPRDPFLPTQHRQVTLSTVVSLRNISFPDLDDDLVQPDDCCPEEDE